MHWRDASRHGEWEKKGNSFDPELSDEIRHRLEYSRPSLPYPKKTLLIFLFLGILAILCGVHYGLIVSFTLLLLFILAIRQSDKEGDALQVNCPQCAVVLEKQWRGNIEFFHCPRCKIYAIGRDESS